MSDIIIKVEGLEKRYGEAVVLQDINLEFKKGMIYGLVGRNGSGKTMLMKSICGFIFPTKGKVIVQGKEVGKDVDIPPHIGVIIEQPGFLPGYSAYSNLYFLSRINGIAGKKQIKDALELVGLGNTGNKKVGKFSMGMRQRLGIAQAIMEEPDILILDEPMNGLDNIGVEDMRKVLFSLREQGKTIIMASHNREDIETLCDEVYRMDKGRIIN